MKRRLLLSQAALGSTGAALLTACSRPHTSINNTADFSTHLPKIQWKMATSWPKKLDILFGGAERLAQRVREMTQGQFSITPYPSGEIAPGLKVLDVVAEGVVECGHTASYYYLDKDPALAFGTNVPFGLTAHQQNAWLYYGGGIQAMQKLYQPLGIINFPAGNTGAQMGGWFHKKMEKPADLTNLKMRIPGLGGEVMKRLGVQVEILSAGEIAPALLANKIDAAEWNNPYDDNKIGITKAAPYYYYPGWWEPGATYELQVNLEQWESLPVTYQTILKAAAAEVNTTMLAEYNAKNGKMLQRVRQSGTKVLPFSHNILEEAYAETTQLYESYATTFQSFQEIYSQWQQFRKQIYSWNRINELSFDRFVNQTTD